MPRKAKVMKIKKDDYVQVISGADKGRRGRVLKVDHKENTAIVEGINYIFRHVRKGPKSPQSGRVEKEAPIRISKLQLYCPHCQKTTKVCYSFEKPEVDKDKGKSTETEAHIKLKKVRCCKCDKQRPL